MHYKLDNVFHGPHLTTSLFHAGKFPLSTVHVTSPDWVKAATTHDSCFLPFLLLLHNQLHNNNSQHFPKFITPLSLFFHTFRCFFSLLSSTLLYWETVLGKISYFLFTFPSPSQSQPSLLLSDFLFIVASTILHAFYFLFTFFVCLWWFSYLHSFLL